MARRRKKAGPRKVRVAWTEADGRVLEYVPRLPGELRGELERVTDSVRRALRILWPVRRLRHHCIVSARVQLQNCLRDVPADADEDWRANEIARLSYVMHTALGMLDQLRNSRVKWLGEARFTLTYGQTPKKREPAGSYGAGTGNEVAEEESNG